MKLVVFCLLFFALSGFTKETDSSVGAWTINGIDISKYQEEVDFLQVKESGIRFVLIRATEGITYQDPYFVSNYQSARTAGLVVGAYHFYETNDDPQSQFENFKNVADLQSGDLPPVVDIERLHDKDDQNFISDILSFLKSLESYYGGKPIIYSGLNFSNTYLTQLGGYPLWIAEYGVNEPKIPEGWSNWTFWQRSQSSTINGIKGNVDADTFNGNELSFQRLLLK